MTTYTYAKSILVYATEEVYFIYFLILGAGNKA